MKRAAHAFAFLLCAIVTGAAAPQVQPKTTMVQVAGPIYLLHGEGGGNIAVVVDPSGLFMVDAMEESVAVQIRDLLKSLPGSGRVRILVNTHWHGDHTDGNKAFGSGSAIIAPLMPRASHATTMGSGAVLKDRGQVGQHWHRMARCVSPGIMNIRETSPPKELELTHCPDVEMCRHDNR